MKNKIEQKNISSPLVPKTQSIRKLYTTNGKFYYPQLSVSSSGCYKDGNLKDYLLGKPSNNYFFTYQIKNGYNYTRRFFIC